MAAKKKTKEQLIKELHDEYKGALSEFILKWHESLTGEELINTFWKSNEPNKIREALTSIEEVVSNE